MKIKKNDFIEIEFVGRIKDTGEIFDTNIKEEAEKINLQIETKPLIVCVGGGMLVKGFDKVLEEKEIGKKYKITLVPEDSFGLRNPQLIKIIPMRAFKEKKMNPTAGMMLNFDGMIAKIITASGGRVITDFNNPMAGKDIEYEFTTKKKVEDEKDKINALQDFFFKQRFSFSIKEKKIIFEKKAEPFLKIFGEKFKEILEKNSDIEKSSELSNIKHTKQK